MTMNYTKEEELFAIDKNTEYDPCENDKYYLGSYKYFQGIDQLLLMNQISLRIFYASDYDSLRNYICWYSGTFIPDTRPQIIKVVKKKDVTNAILKTHWIRLIQRTWKRVYREQNTGNIKLRGILHHLKNRTK